MHIEKNAYKSLEIEKIIKSLAKYCRSELGTYTASVMEPSKNYEELQERHRLYLDIEAYRIRKGDLPWIEGLTDITKYLCIAEDSGIISGGELVKIKKILLLAMKLKAVFIKEKATYPVFTFFVQRLRDFTAELDELSVLDEEGHIYDSASEELKTVREQMRIIRDNIKNKATNIMNSPSISSMLQDKVLVMRNGRHAFLVRQDALSTFPGVVMDRSGSGNSVYMEPNSLLRLNNEFATCISTERFEEQKILRNLTTQILKRAKAIIDAQNIIGIIDLFYSFSEKQKREHWVMPKLSSKSMFYLKKARHPLLSGHVTPIDIHCGENFDILVITGPNTGGKTVALKTAGICVFLGWMGFPLPVDKDSVIGVVDEIFADIGDEQSIEQSLSTFSAHVKNVTDILKKVTPNSLVLLDELGAGTDPEEGAALGIALLDWLHKKGALALATTHHNPIKRFALITDRIETASVEFNASTLSPTYKILVGIPGRSNALLIASKLGMPKEIIKRAGEAINGHEISMEDLIGELQDKRTELENRMAEVETLRHENVKLKYDYEQRMDELDRKKEKIISNADKKAVSIVRNAEESAKALIKNLENATIESTARRELEKKRSHFQRIEKSADKREEHNIAKKSVMGGPEPTIPEEGDIVKIIGTNGSATVLSVRGKKAKIQAGMVEIEVPLKRLALLEKKADHNDVLENNIKIKVSRPVNVPSSLMIRMMTVDEAMPLTSQYIDRAFRAGYDSVTIIHGRGEGILRREVHALCKRIPYIDEYRLGGPGEGGYGVTIIKFKQ